MPFTKQQVRKDFLQKRNLLSQTRYEDLSYGLLEQFKLLELKGVKCLHMFLPIHKRKEPDTFLIRDWLRAVHPEIKIVYPKTNFADYTIQSFLDNENLQLEINAFGITEPISGDEVTSDQIDLMLVPLLAFDAQGYRAGYGKGFYDRFMGRCGSSTQFVGLSFFEPVDQLTDIDEFDIKLNNCITPSRIWKFR